MPAIDLTGFGLVPPAKKIHPPEGPRDVASILDRPLVHCSGMEALVDAGRRMTYAELDRAVSACCDLFSKLGIGKGDRVAASLPNRCDIVIAFMATQRLGAIWVGINLVLSPKEKGYILRHSETRLLLTDKRSAGPFEDLVDELPDLQQLFVIDGPDRSLGWEGLFSAEAVVDWSDVEIDPFAPATIMYTSGTTGSPKGVVHSQHNMVTLCASASSSGLLDPDARRGAVLPLTITNVMILTALLAFWNSKACVCGTSPKTREFVDWLRKERIGHCAVVPTMVYDLLQADLDLPDCYRMAAGGAPLPMPIRERFKKRYGYPLGGSYGLTEAPTVVTETRRLEAPAGASGLPLPHLRVLIRDEYGNCVPEGTIGEVCVSAATEGPWANVYTPPLGYWKDGENSEKLLRDGVLHTGDMGRLDDDGWLYLADRSSELILRAGSNIYPGEIERVFYEHSAVADCALVGKTDARLGMRTVAFVQPADGDADIKTLRQELIEMCLVSLARYKVPDEWHFVSELPRNAMGKIVKPRLREMVEQATAESRG